MSRYSLKHLSDQSLLRELKSLVSQERATKALLVAHLGEVDARQLVAPTEPASNGTLPSSGTLESGLAEPQLPAPAPQQIVPLAPGRFLVRCTVDRATYERIEYARELLGHSVPNGELAQLVALALKALIAELEG